MADMLTAAVKNMNFDFIPFKCEKLYIYTTFQGLVLSLKGALVEFQSQNFNIYSINEVIRQTWSVYFVCKWINELFLEENKQHKGESELRLSIVQHRPGKEASGWHETSLDWN